MQYNANVTDDCKLENGKHCHLKKQTKKKCHVVAPHLDKVGGVLARSYAV